MREEIEYLTDIFCENGHDRKTLQKIINSFENKTRGTNNNNNNNDNNNNNNNNNNDNNSNNNNSNNNGKKSYSEVNIVKTCLMALFSRTIYCTKKYINSKN